MKKICCLLWILFSLVAYSYSQDFDWVKGITAQHSSQTRLIAVDGSGNSYMAGGFNGTVDFDPGPSVYSITASGSQDGFVVKLDSLGNFIWAKHFACNTFSSPVASIALDDTGQVYLAGWFERKADFDPGQDTFFLSTTGNGNEDAYVCILSANGDFISAKQVGGTGRDRAQTIAVDQQRNIYFSGSLASPLGDFNPGPGTYFLSGNGSDGTDFVCSLNRNGDFRWAVELENPNGLDVRDLALDNWGNLFLGGTYSDATDFDPSNGVFYQGIRGGSDAFIEKLDSAGNFIWVRVFGGYFYESINSISIDDSANVLLAGNFGGQVDFDPGLDTFEISVSGNLFSPNHRNGFVAKLGKAGDFLWARKFGGIDLSQGLGIAHDQFLNVYATGQFYDSTDWDPLGAGWIFDGEIGSAFIAKYGPAGNLLWVGRLGGNGGLANGIGIALDSNRNIYTTGSYWSSADFDPGPGQVSLSSQGANDRYIHKMKQCEPSLSQLAVSGCGAFISPSGAQIWSMSGQYHDVISTVQGCDSVMEINFNLVTIDTTVTYASNSLVANTSNLSYQWLDCGNSYAAIPGANAQSFSPSNNGSYAVELTINNCVDTSSCWNLIIVGNVTNPGLNFMPIIYPNPSNGSFLVVLPKGEMAERVQIFDLQGRIIYDQNPSETGSIPVRLMQSPGAYCLSVKYSNGQSVQKMLLLR